MNEIGSKWIGKAESNMEDYQSHDPSNFHQALSEFNSYCERQLPKTFPTIFTPTCFDISDNEENIVIGGVYGNTANLELVTGQILRDEEISRNLSVTQILMTLNDTQVLIINEAFQLFILSFPSFEILGRVQLNVFPTVMQYHKRDESVYILNSSKEIKVYNLCKEEDFYSKIFVSKILPLEDESCYICMNNDCSFLAIGLNNGMISVVHLDSEKKIKETGGYKSRPSLIIFSENSSHLAAAFEDFSIKV